MHAGSGLGSSLVKDNVWAIDISGLLGISWNCIKSKHDSLH